MFTGLIEKTAKFIEKKNGFLKIENPFGSEVTKGDSIAVNGVCLTVDSLDKEKLIFSVSNETLSRTNLGLLKTLSVVNLERALKLSDRLGGHFVTGHVDSLGELEKNSIDGNSRIMKFTYPNSSFTVEKGSIAVNGISLTCYDIRNGSFRVSVIAHTFENTNLKFMRVRDKVNLEFDLLAKYSKNTAKVSNITKDFLKENGF